MPQIITHNSVPNPYIKQQLIKNGPPTPQELTHSIPTHYIANGKPRIPSAHSIAVGKLIKATGMGLGHASRYVKQHGLARK